jgi:hypothetical protein
MDQSKPVSSYRLTKIGKDGVGLPAHATGHDVVLLERDILARPLYWTAQRSSARMTWAEAKAWAESLTINGWLWRLPTVEEAVLLCDRSRTQEPVVNPAYFPDCDGEGIWTNTEDRLPPFGNLARFAGPEVAWLVGLRYGYSDRFDSGLRLHVRAVRAGRSAP